MVPRGQDLNFTKQMMFSFCLMLAFSSYYCCANLKKSASMAENSCLLHKDTKMEVNMGEHRKTQR